VVEICTGGCGKDIDKSVDGKNSFHGFVTFRILPIFCADSADFLVDSFWAGEPLERVRQCRAVGGMRLFLPAVSGLRKKMRALALRRWTIVISALYKEQSPIQEGI
jgi:hypothetical protein